MRPYFSLSLADATADSSSHKSRDFGMATVGDESVADKSFVAALTLVRRRGVVVDDLPSIGELAED